MGYETVDDALEGLRSQPSVSFSIENGWTIAADEENLTVWSFAPAGYPAYPAVVKRQVIEREGQVRLVMSVLCEGSKADCDELVRTFSRMNGLD